MVFFTSEEGHEKLKFYGKKFFESINNKLRWLSANVEGLQMAEWGVKVYWIKSARHK